MICFSDINSLVMDYLVTNGYPLAARKFAVEANIQPQADFESIQQRVNIRNAIYAGDIKSAIERTNELNPRVCAPILVSSRISPFTFVAMIISVSCTTHIPLWC